NEDNLKAGNFLNVGSIQNRFTGYRDFRAPHWVVGFLDNTTEQIGIAAIEFLLTYRRDVNDEYVEYGEDRLIVGDCRDKCAAADVIAGGSHDVFLALVDVVNQRLKLGRTHL